MSSRVLTRVLLSVLAGALCGVAVTCGVLLVRQPGSAEVARVDVGAPGLVDRGRARAVLRRWDAARARAWTTGDADALDDLYTPGSVAGARDVAMLRAWSARGARLTTLTTQVLRLEVVVERERRLVLVVTDRVAQVRVAVRSVGLSLPRDRASTRRIVLLRAGPAGGDATWRVESVSPEAPGPS